MQKMYFLVALFLLSTPTIVFAQTNSDSNGADVFDALTGLLIVGAFFLWIGSWLDTLNGWFQKNTQIKAGGKLAVITFIVSIGLVISIWVQASVLERSYSFLYSRIILCVFNLIVLYYCWVESNRIKLLSLIRYSLLSFLMLFFVAFTDGKILPLIILSVLLLCHRQFKHALWYFCLYSTHFISVLLCHRQFKHALQKNISGYAGEAFQIPALLLIWVFSKFLIEATQSTLFGISGGILLLFLRFSWFWAKEQEKAKLELETKHKAEELKREAEETRTKKKQEQFEEEQKRKVKEQLEQIHEFREYVRQTGVGSPAEIETLQHILKIDHNLNFSISELKPLLEQEQLKQAYDQFKEIILAKNPKNFNEYLDAFAKNFRRGTETQKEYFKKLLTEKDKYTSAANVLEALNTANMALELNERAAQLKEKLNAGKKESGKNLLSERKYTIDEVDKMSGHVFEDFLVKMFRAMGYDCRRMPKTGDQGADIILSKYGIKTVVQAKRHNTAINNKAIQEAHAAKAHYNCSEAIVVTNNYFTEGARALAKSTKVGLWDRTLLRKHISEYLD